MHEITFIGYTSIHWSNGPWDYADGAGDFRTAYPRFDGCNNDTRNKLMEEYSIYPVGTTAPASIPQCSDFTSSRSASYFSFNEINTGDFSMALIRDPLVASSSSGHGLDKWRSNYGSARSSDSLRAC